MRRVYTRYLPVAGKKGEMEMGTGNACTHRTIKAGERRVRSADGARLLSFFFTLKQNKQTLPSILPLQGHDARRAWDDLRAGRADTLYVLYRTVSFLPLQ